MNKEMQALTEWVIKTAKNAGANDCKVSFSSNRSVEISYRQQKPENIKEASTKDLNIEIFVNGRYSSQTTSDLRKKALEEFIGNAVKTTKLLTEDPYRTLPDAKYYQGQAQVDLELVDPAYESFSPEKRHETVKAIENACLKKGGDKVISVTASVQDAFSESVMMTSNGFNGYSKGTYYVAYAEMTARDEGDRRPNSYYYAVAITRKEMPKPEDIGIETANRTLALLGAKKLKTETLPVIIQNDAVGRIIDGLLSPMSGRSIQQKRSFLADKKGQLIAADKLTLIDDPLIKRGLSSQLYDSDGLAAKKRTIIDAGVLKEFYIDWYYSRKLGCDPTTGNQSNLIIPPGKRSVAEIMKDLGRGILITGFIGGNSNPTTGDTSIGIIGHLFDQGKPVQPISEMNIADNHLKFWHKLTEVANDPWIYSSSRFPSLVFDKIVVAGL